jgi:SAM-dependent methyltransferase
MLTRRCLLAAFAVPKLRPQEGNRKMFGNAEAYERFMGRWSRLTAPLLIDFAGVPDAGRVLDVGSGTGSLAFEIGRRRTGAQVTGIDMSEEYVAYARSRNPFPERIEFQKGDAQGLQFADGTFAASVSLLVFNFIPEPMKALREARRVTRRNGPVAAAVWDYGERMRMLRDFWDAAVDIDARAEKLDEKHMPLCRSGDLSRLWKEGGLTDVREQPLDVLLRFESFSDYWDPFLLGQGPAGAYARSLDGARLTALRSAVRRKVSVSSESDAFTLPARAWAVYGRVEHNCKGKEVRAVQAAAHASGDLRHSESMGRRLGSNPYGVGIRGTGDHERGSRFLSRAA